MSDDWENEDYEPTLPGSNASNDRWQGEDEDDDVKDNWEDDDENQPKAYQRPKKKSLAEKIAEKERLKEGDATKNDKEESKELTAEEKLAEKIRLQKIQEEADLKIAKGLFGEEASNRPIESMYPQDQAEFDQFSEALKTKITFFQDSKLYPAFVSQLINDISVTLPSEEIKKIGNTLNSLYHEKEKIKKEQAKNQKKKKQKATIRKERVDDLGLADGTAAYYDYDEEEDFI